MLVKARAGGKSFTPQPQTPSLQNRGTNASPSHANATGSLSAPSEDFNLPAKLRHMHSRQFPSFVLRVLSISPPYSGVRCATGYGGEGARRKSLMVGGQMKAGRTKDGKPAGTNAQGVGTGSISIAFFFSDNTGAETGSGQSHLEGQTH